MVDDEALADALERGTIAGAGLDVFEGEPRVNPRLRGLCNVLLSPHAGTNTRATHARMAQEAVSNLLEAMAGRVPPSCLNREALDARAR